MQRTFKTTDGKTIAPNLFAVYHKKNGDTFMKIQDEISEYNFSEYEDIKKVELFQNGSENLAPEMIDCLHNSD